MIELNSKHTARLVVIIKQ